MTTKNIYIARPSNRLAVLVETRADDPRAQFVQLLDAVEGFAYSLYLQVTQGAN